MKKATLNVFRGSIAMLLTLCLIFGCTGTALAVKIGEDNTLNYVSLGASQTNGYGLQGYLPITVDKGNVPADQMPLLQGLLTGEISKDTINVYGYQRLPEGGYPDLVRDALEAEGYEVNVDQLAISSMRAEELRMLLDNSYYGDSYTAWRFYDENGNGWFSSAAREEGMTNEEALAALRAEYQSALAAADLVTVDIGVNNFGVYAINRIDTGLDDPENPKYDADITAVLEGDALDRYDTVRSLVDALVMSYASDAGEESEAALDVIIDTFAYALLGFCVNFDKSMEAIYELNPDATVVVVSIQNLLDGMTAKIPGMEGELPLDDIYGAIVDLANLYTAVGSPYADRYYYAAAGDVSLFLDDILLYDGNPDNLSQDMRDCFGLYDNDLFGWELMLKYGVYEGADISAGADAVYDALAQIAKACAQQSVLDFGDLATMDDAENVLGTYIETVLQEAFVAGMAGQEYVLDTTVLEDPANHSAMAMAIRFTIGNSFFAHPNRQGHQERADAIIAALENETRGAEVADVETAQYLSLITGQEARKYSEAVHADYTITNTSAYVALGDNSAYTALMSEYLTGEAANSGLGYHLIDLAVDDSRITEAPDVIKDNLIPIAMADIISIGYGNTTWVEDAVGVMIDALMSGVEAVDPIDWEALLGAEKAAYVTQIMGEINEKLVSEGMDMKPPLCKSTVADAVTLALESYAYDTVVYAGYLPEIINGIQSINPDALIMVVGMGNPCEGTVFDMGDGSFDLGEYIGLVVDIADIVCTVNTMLSENVVYVSAPHVGSNQTGVELNILDLRTLRDLLRNGLPVDITDEGNAYIFEQMKAALTVSVEIEAVMGDIDGNGEVDLMDANLAVAYYNETADLTEAQLALADVDGNGDVDLMDANLIVGYYNETVDSFPAGQ